MVRVRREEFQAFQQLEIFPSVIPDKGGAAGRRSGIQTYFALKARLLLFLWKKCSLMLTLMRWVPDRRAALAALVRNDEGAEKTNSCLPYPIPIFPLYTPPCVIWMFLCLVAVPPG